MSRFRLAALMLAAVSFLPAGLAAADQTHNQNWQEGEILSRKTIAPGHHNLRTRYVYRIKSGGLQYVARFDQPLSLAPYAPFRFSAARRHLWVRDADGSELKADILKKSDIAIRR